ncbi:hypothetical protein RHSIM_Rhsim03G0061500 [Rhododendron simsii]|uniref:Putative plant transposon protein domain-containing protein n=1 Tax=Rhododendron simsii TaxID=118357 RepID=A0A834LPI6_RHOSS|nr:hypothetical protein RHSIM_Rhsim03G0061500 [Rhododendron simsii]
MGDAIKSVDSSGKTSYMKRSDREKQAERADRDEEENRKRKREKKDEEKRKWEKALKGRKYICERQVDRTRMGTHAIVDIINQRGLQFFFDPIKGFKPKLVLDFYSNMEVDEKEEKITSRLGKKTVLVTPTIIAKYLKNYQRPSHRSTTYPKHGWSKTEEEIKNTLTDKPLKQDRFVHGRLFEKYRVINKVVHYNLCPHSSEKLPRREDGEVIFVFGSSDEVVDWALLIWNSMVRFRNRTAPSKPNIPFPAMNKLKTQMRRTRRDVSAIKRGMLWIAARCGKEGDVYTPTEADMRESTPEEPEIDHGAGTSGGESSTRRRGKEHAVEHDDTDESDDEEDD